MVYPYLSQFAEPVQNFRLARKKTETILRNVENGDSELNSVNTCKEP